MNMRPQTGDIYRHFKNKMYQIVAIARHSETQEELVIYQALYGDYSVYARPLEMFISEVDHVKYPQVTQKYRFEKIDKATLEPACPVTTENRVETEQVTSSEEIAGNVEEPWADKRIMDFLDADTYAKKLDLLTLYQKNMDDKFINAIAASLDTIVPEGDIEERYMSIRSYLQTQVKFECNRLR